MIGGTSGELGIEVTPEQVSVASIPIAIFAFVYALIQYYLFDRKLDRRLEPRQPDVKD